MNTIVLVAGGHLTDDLLHYIPAHALLVGVDRGALWLLHHNLTPTLALGDFDSVTAEERAFIERRVGAAGFLPYPSHKNETDMELAFRWALRKTPREIRVLGGIGSRLDHSWGTLQLLERHRKADIRVIVFDAHNRMELLSAGSHAVLKSADYTYVSLLSVTPASTVSLSGFVYSLERGRIRRGSSLAISNELAASTGTVTVHEGRVWLIASRD